MIGVCVETTLAELEKQKQNLITCWNQSLKVGGLKSVALYVLSSVDCSQMCLEHSFLF